MSSIKESLYKTIELLSEKEARQIMKLIRLLRKNRAGSRTLQRLAIDTAFNIPVKKPKARRIVKPIRGKGVPASTLLVENRR
ncbi:MAG: hypothetical protein ABIJ56_01070 [Pseudomonadota bacterium]